VVYGSQETVIEENPLLLRIHGVHYCTEALLEKHPTPTKDMLPFNNFYFITLIKHIHFGFACWAPFAFWGRQIFTK
jgi:hypothetical protein